MSLSVSSLTNLVANAQSRALPVGPPRQSRMRSTQMGMGTQRHPPVQRLVHEPARNCRSYS